MLSNKAKYGLKALMHLAGAEGQCLAGDIAKDNNIPRKFLDAILVELRNAGILNSRKGKGGGYQLARPAEKITVGQIIRILDGPLAPIPCASKTAEGSVLPAWQAEPVAAATSGVAASTVSPTTPSMLTFKVLGKRLPG